MFFTQEADWKREVAINLLGTTDYGRGVFLERRFGLEHSEVWEIRKRLRAALEPRPGGRPPSLHVTNAAGECARCPEKDREIARLQQEFAAERERGRKDLIRPASRAPPAVLPGAARSIPLLVKAAFQTTAGRETIRTYICQASRNAAELMRSLPWAESIDPARFAGTPRSTRCSPAGRPS